MSSLLSLSTPRLEKAVERSVKIGRDDDARRFSVRELREALLRRGMSERDIHSLFFKIIGALEPSSCTMTHCENFGGSGAPMNCALERIPGRCSVLKQFKERQVRREWDRANARSEAPVSAGDAEIAP